MRRSTELSNARTRVERPTSVAKMIDAKVTDGWVGTGGGVRDAGGMKIVVRPKRGK